MYSAYNSSLEKNQMMTPPTIGLTSSIVNDKLSNITLEDNSNGLFSMNEDNSAIQTKDGVPLEASQFKITSSNTEINNDDTNAVNKSYCDSNYIRDEASSVTFGNVNLSNSSNPVVLSSLKSTNSDTSYFRVTHQVGNSTYYYLQANKDRLAVGTIGLGYTGGVMFNCNSSGNRGNVGVPQNNLKNIITSTTTKAELTNFDTLGYLDNVCPTYQFCENTYARASDVESTYLKQDDAETTYAKTTDIVKSKSKQTTKSIELTPDYTIQPVSQKSNGMSLLFDSTTTTPLTDVTLDMFPTGDYTFYIVDLNLFWQYQGTSDTPNVIATLVPESKYTDMEMHLYGTTGQSIKVAKVEKGYGNNLYRIQLRHIATNKEKMYLYLQTQNSSAIKNTSSDPKFYIIRCIFTIYGMI